MLRALFSVVAITSGLLFLGAAHSNAIPSNGSLLVPGDVPTPRFGVQTLCGYVADRGSTSSPNRSTQP